MAADSEDDILGQQDGDIFDEEELLRYYFNRGFGYNNILTFLRKYHSYTISYRTLLRRLRKYGLKRRNRDAYLPQITHDAVRQKIQGMINGPGSAGGYRTVWHSLELEGIRVPRSVVQSLLKELDPEGSENRKRHRLRRRRYVNPGPNFAWHIDGYDKIKPWGFPIHGAIDGYSRRILWLQVTRSNNAPDNIACLYLTAVNTAEGCPVELITDLGTENSIVAAIQSYFRGNSDAHRYVSSPRNQRIECWWSQFCKQRACWWRNFFKDLDSTGEIDTASEIKMEALWYSFSGVLQNDLDLVKEHWNTHRIRKSKFQTVAGRPDALYFLPEQTDTRDYKNEVTIEAFQDVSEHVVVRDYSNEYTMYFDYLTEENDIQNPVEWTDALELYRFILSVCD